MVEKEFGSLEGEVGFSLQDIARQDLLNAYWRVRKWSKVLVEEEVKFGGLIKTKTALESLNDLYYFVDDFEVKNKLWYKRKELEQFKKFTFFFFRPYLQLINSYKVQNKERMPVSGYTNHYRRWKLLCKLGMEVSGITKFERPKELTSELAFASGAG